MANEFMFEKLTWLDIKEASKERKVILLPIGMIEDHGPHLPVDTDSLIASEICKRTARKIPEQVLVMPTVKYGYSPHHMDFPGTITITWSTLVEYILDICKSLIHHKFKKILIINGHGSNAPLGEMAARLSIIENSDAHCGFISWWELSGVQKYFNNIRESKIVSHAGELETSLYLAINNKNVQMDKARKDMSCTITPHFWSDITGRKPESNFKNPVHMTEFWSTVTKNGVKGDPTKANKEKGEKILEKASEELVKIIHEFKSREIKTRQKHQIED